jgi:hypothetical protein
VRKLQAVSEMQVVSKKLQGPRWHGAREGDASSEGEPGGEEELVIEEEVE